MIRTDEEKEAVRLKLRAAVRRRYAEDETYREKCKERSRENYRKHKEYISNYLKNLPESKKMERRLRNSRRNNQRYAEDDEFRENRKRYARERYWRLKTERAELRITYVEPINDNENDKTGISERTWQ